MGWCELLADVSVPIVERKQAHLNRKGSCRSRYFGLQETRLQLFWTGTMVNIERLMSIGQAVASLRVAGTALA